MQTCSIKWRTTKWKFLFFSLLTVQFFPILVHTKLVYKRVDHMQHLPVKDNLFYIKPRHYWCSLVLEWIQFSQSGTSFQWFNPTLVPMVSNINMLSHGCHMVVTWLDSTYFKPHVSPWYNNLCLIISFSYCICCVNFFLASRFFSISCRAANCFSL